MNQPDTLPVPNVLEARDLSVVRGGQPVLDIPLLEVRPGEVLVVIGPNGSGKTTLLLSLAFLLQPAGGTVSYRGQTGGDRSSILRLRRSFAVVFQEALLLNTTVWDNVTLGLRLRGVEREEAKARAEKWLERFGIASLARRQARTLSGGEAKRVSLARAFVLQPEVLFLDEPFSALDSPTRQALLEDFESVLRETKVTTVMVTHERHEALVLGQRVAVIMNGSIRQIGTPEEVFSSPIDEEVAAFVEAGNILHGVVERQSEGLASIRVGERQIDVVANLPPGARLTAYLHYEDITLAVPPPTTSASSARNHLPGKVTRVMPFGSQVRVTVDCGLPLVALITKRSYEEMKLAAGQPVVASFKASSVHLVSSH